MVLGLEKIKESCLFVVGSFLSWADFELHFFLNDYVNKKGYERSSPLTSTNFIAPRSGLGIFDRVINYLTLYT